MQIQNKQKIRQRGYTLIEVLIALAISVIGIMGGLTLYRSGHKAANVVTTTSEIQQGIRKALELMSVELQETTTDSIDLGVSNAISFASASGDAGFEVNANGTPHWQNAVVYFLDTEKSMLYRYVSAKDNWDTNFDTASAFAVDEEQLEELVSHVTNLEFELIDNMLEITVEISRDLSNADLPNPVVNEVSTQVLLRN